MTAAQRCVLAYSGGLDTSVAIPWMRENLDTEVIALSIDLGEARDLRTVQERALRTGATAAYVVDARRLFVENFAQFAEHVDELELNRLEFADRFAERDSIFRIADTLTQDASCPTYRSRAQFVAAHI